MQLLQRNERAAADADAAQTLVLMVEGRAAAGAEAAQLRELSFQSQIEALARERLRQRRAAITRAAAKKNSARTALRAATGLAKLRLQLCKAQPRLAEGGDTVMIKTRKSDARRSHCSSNGAIAFLRVRDAGSIPNKKVAAVVGAFDSFRTGGDSFRLRSPSSRTVARLLLRWLFLTLCLQTDELTASLATGKVDGVCAPT